MAKSAAGAGTIRKKTRKRPDGTDYVYWEARYTVGYDPATGSQKQKSITGKTQREVSRKLKEATAALDAGTYLEPCRITLSQWLDTWESKYLLKQKYLTKASYRAAIKNHIKPELGGIRLDQLSSPMIQTFYVNLYKTLSPKTVLNIHGVLHKALQQAVKANLLRQNPADGCELTTPGKADIRPLDAPELGAFLTAIQGHIYENLYTVILLLGLRESEALGLTWDCVDFETGNVTINKQLQAKTYELVPTKNSEIRKITASRAALTALKSEKYRQMEVRMKLGAGWDPSGLCFTNAMGEHLCHTTVYKNFKRLAAQIGCPDTRLHDLRHSYAVLSLQAGDDIKTVQEHLGHATASFTLDVYGHVTESMQQASANRQDAYLESIKNA